MLNLALFLFFAISFLYVGVVGRKFPVL